MELADLLLLATKGVLVASLPIALAWTVRGSDRLQRLAAITAFFTFDLIVFGAFTRLTDSGLGCPDWPGCYAKANPIAALTDIHAAQALMPDGPVTVFKAWIEMLHRYLAMGVGLLIVVMVVLAWLRARGRSQKPWLTTALLGLVCLQGAFGAWTVTLKLQPVIVTTHLLLGMLLLAMLIWHAALLAERPADLPLGSALRLRPLVWLASALLVLQIALGGWVSTNYAVLACNQFPMCQGLWVPEMDFESGFHLWRELGRTADNSGYISLAALTAIHWVHRTIALPVVLVLAGLCVAAWHLAALRFWLRWLAFLLAAQLITGVANVLLGWPLLAAVLHNAGAAGLVVVLVMLNYRIAQAARSTRRDGLSVAV